MRLSLIVAIADDRVIGLNNELPWRLSADLARFKDLTMDHYLIMGRRTFESIGRALSGRKMVVVSRRSLDLPEGVELAHSVEEAIEIARAAGETEAFVAGGAEVYREMLPRADRMYLTRIHAGFPGDVFFPEYDESEWRLVSKEDLEPDERNPHPFSFLVYERNGD